MMQIKYLFGAKESEIEESVNEWIREELPFFGKVIDIKFMEDRLVAYILYDQPTQREEQEERGKNNLTN
jgi:hypothetical protein